METALLEQVRISVSRPYLQNDFILRALFIILVEDKIFTQEKLADILMVSVPTIDRWSRGRNMPHTAIRHSIFKCLEQELTKKLRPNRHD